MTPNPPPSEPLAPSSLLPLPSLWAVRAWMLTFLLILCLFAVFASTQNNQSSRVAALSIGISLFGIVLGIVSMTWRDEAMYRDYFGWIGCTISAMGIAWLEIPVYKFLGHERLDYAFALSIPALAVSWLVRHMSNLESYGFIASLAVTTGTLAAILLLDTYEIVALPIGWVGAYLLLIIPLGGWFVDISNYQTTAFFKGSLIILAILFTPYFVVQDLSQWFRSRQTSGNA